MAGNLREVRAAERRVRWRERLFGLRGPLLPAADPTWTESAVILLYHRVSEPGHATLDPFTVTETAFDEQMGWLAAHFRVVPVRDLVMAMSRGSVNGLAAITFDDGYACTVSRALPVLRRHGLCATVFVDTARLNSGGASLSDAGVRALAAAGVEVGSHTVTHPNLLDVDDATLARELRESRERLAALTDTDIAGFAHPFGRYDDRVTRAVADAGYSYACTTRQHRPVRPHDDPLQLTRIEINAGD